jgi:four helix bundle protein
MRDHRNLRAFQLADDLVLSIYEATKVFPREEMFGLTSQVRRASVSVAANIVEGCGRDSDAEYSHFLNIAFGSLREVGYYIHLAHRLNYLSQEVAETLTSKSDEAARVLSGLMRALRRKE